MDGDDPEVVDEKELFIKHTQNVEEVAEIQVRWMGHKMRAEINVAVDPRISVKEGYQFAKNVHNLLLDQLEYLSSAIIQVDP